MICPYLHKSYVKFDDDQVIMFLDFWAPESSAKAWSQSARGQYFVTGCLATESLFNIPLWVTLTQWFEHLLKTCSFHMKRCPTTSWLWFTAPLVNMVRLRPWLFWNQASLRSYVHVWFNYVYVWLNISPHPSIQFIYILMLT